MPKDQVEKHFEQMERDAEAAKQQTVATAISASNGKLSNDLKVTLLGEDIPVGNHCAQCDRELTPDLKGIIVIISLEGMTAKGICPTCLVGKSNKT